MDRFVVLLIIWICFRVCKPLLQIFINMTASQKWQNVKLAAIIIWTWQKNNLSRGRRPKTFDTEETQGIIYSLILTDSVAVSGDFKT